MPDDGDGGGEADDFGDEVAVEFVDARNGLAGKGDDDIAFAEAGAACGAAGFDAGDEDAVFDRQVVKPDDAPVDGHFLADDADPTAADSSLLDQPCGDEFGGVAGDGEADALGGQYHRRIHADDFATRIHQRAAGISWVQGGVGLDHVVNQPAGLGAHGTSQRANHTGGDGVLESVRAADGDGDLSDADGIRVAQPRMGEPRGVDANHRQIRFRVFANHGGIEHQTVREPHFKFDPAVNDVAVRENEAVRRDDKTGAAASGFGLGLAMGFVNANVHHRRTDGLDHTGDGV